MDARPMKQCYRVQDNEGSASMREGELVPVLSSVQVKFPIDKSRFLYNYSKFNELGSFMWHIFNFDYNRTDIRPPKYFHLMVSKPYT